MKKIIVLLITLVAFGELKAQNKQLEFTVEKPDVGVDIIIDEYLVVGWKRELKFTTKNKNKQYRFTFTHGTIEQKEQILLLNPNKTGEGIIKIYELIEKKYILVKEVVVDIFEMPMYCFGKICFSYMDEINDITILIKPFTLKFKNEIKELVLPIEKFRISWICNGILTENKISGNVIDKKILNSIDKTCNPIKLFIENIYYKGEKTKSTFSFKLLITKR